MAWPDARVAQAAPVDAGAIVGGTAHACMLRAGGEVWCWGANAAGQIGDGPDSSTPAPDALIAFPVDTSGVLAGRTVTRLAAGGDSTCALDSAGAAHCWGENFGGQLGTGVFNADSAAPVAVTGALTFDVISVGYFHSCGLTAAGVAWCWGENARGQIGNGTAPSDSAVPVAVTATGALAGRTLTGLATGDEFSWLGLLALGLGASAVVRTRRRGIRFVS